MQSIQTQNVSNLAFDLKGAVTKNRLVGLWRLMKGFRPLYLGAIMTMALGASMRTLNYVVLSYVIDTVIGEGLHAERLPLFGLAFVGLAAMEGLLSYLRGVWTARTAEGVTLRLRNYLYDHVQRLPFAYHDHAKTGELIQRATSDLDTLRRFYADQAVGIGRIVALFTVNLVVLVRMNWLLGLLSVVIMPAILALSIFFFGKVSKAYERYQEQEAVVSSRLQENLAGVRVVRAFARQEHEKEKFERENWKKYVLGKKLLVMHSAYWPISDTLCTAQMLLVMGVGALMAINGGITIGTYVAMTGIVIWIVWPLRNLGRLIVQVSTGLVSYRRVADIIAQDREDIDAGEVRITRPVRGEIVFRDVRFAYKPPPQIGEAEPSEGGGEVQIEQEAQTQESARDRKNGAPTNGSAPDAASTAAATDEPVTVLHDLSFRCEPGQAIALLGSTGSGKTSIINLLLRFYDYDQGSILLDGEELRNYAPAELRQQIGIVEQEPFLFSRTIRENITYGARRPVTQAEIEEAAKAAAIHEIILTFPQGYDTLVGEKGVTLSGGQRQRVAIARTLLRDPRILVLDDATSSVDTETEAQIRTALERLMRGRTSFVIAHRVQSLMGADLILVLDKGRIVQQGTHDELVRQPGMYARIYDLQARIEQELESEVTDVVNL
jgi:ATP-binding cassette subfamily B protein